MNAFHERAYNMAAVSATVALYRALIKKAVLRERKRCDPARRSGSPGNQAEHRRQARGGKPRWTSIANARKS